MAVEENNNMPDLEYSIRVDGFEIGEVTLSYSQYRTQHERNKVRKSISQFMGIPAHYIRLCRKTDGVCHDD